jgi:hypothetical protein
MHPPTPPWRSRETIGCYADYSIPAVLDAHLPADGAAVSAKVSIPDVVGDDHGGFPRPAIRPPPRTIGPTPA